MSSFFIRLYLDEDVNVLVADLLNAKGFNALTVRAPRKIDLSMAETIEISWGILNKIDVLSINLN
jgi:hypothetical protein